MAMQDSESTLSYAQLELAVAKTAAALEELGVRRGDRGGVWAPKCARAITMLYAIMRAGAAYVPLDPRSPQVRALTMIDDAGCGLVCADGERLDAIRAKGAPALDIDEDVSGLDPVHASRACESDLAYILYTSGSTGRPKGVMLTHRNGLSFVEWAVSRFGVRSDDRLSSHAPLHFDLSIFDLYGAAMAGASLHLLAAGEEALAASMVAAIRRHGITVWYSVPSALMLLPRAASEADLSALRIVLFAGEVFSMKYLRVLRALVPHAVIAKLYVPTHK